VNGKNIFGLLLCIAVYSFGAADFRTVTGSVSQVRSGTKSVFYTFRSDDGSVFEANSAWDDVAANADRLQRAFESGERLIVEFQSHRNFPEASIWKIKRIEPVIANPEPETPNAERTSELRSLISAPPSRQSSRPNVLLIVSDDQGAGDFGFMGNQTVKTPNLDRLVSESALFRQFVVCPACSPTRASLLTGRNHMKAGVWGVGERNNLMRDETLMPKFFKEAGYHTGYFGKRDGTYSVELEAWHRGCDEVTHVTGYQHKDPKTYTQAGVVQRVGWTCDLDTAAALDFIERQGDEPWWVAVPYLLPHLPWVADPKFVQPYLDAGCSQKLADVYGCITQMDAAIGDLLAGIAQMGHAENTIVVFLSDNGPSYKGMSDADMSSRNPLGLQGQKALVWENGIRVPFAVKWPGKIPAGERTQFATVEDVLPTLLDLAGVREEGWPAHLPFDGISICDALTDPAAPSVSREVFRVAISYEGQAGGGAWAVNDPQAVLLAEQHVILHGPRYKFHNFAGGKTALFDLQADPGESTDVSGQFPEVAAQYAAELDRQYAEIQATGRTYQMPVVKIGPPEFRYNKISGLHVRRYQGGLHKVLPVDVGGFTAAGDRAEYAVLVEEPGEFMIEVNGKDLNAGSGWQLEANGKKFLPVESGSDALCFGPVAFPEKGEDSFAVSVTGDGAARQQSVISTLVFTPLK
jgi:arylsulfatase A-like enzyme